MHVHAADRFRFILLISSILNRGSFLLHGMTKYCFASISLLLASTPPRLSIPIEWKRSCIHVADAHMSGTIDMQDER